MKTEKLVSLFDFILLVVLAISMVLFFTGSVGTFNLQNSEQVTLLVYLILTYIIILILVLRFKRIFLARILEKDNQKQLVEKPIFRDIIHYRDRPVIKEIEKPIYIEKKAAPVKKFNFYGSTLQKTYHKEKCRFSGMIKKDHLILRDTRTYFKKKKFHACKNCHPERK